MIWLPFICLGIGAVLGFRNLSVRVINAVDFTTNITLILLMFTIGANIGINDSLIGSLGTIGFRCVMIATLAIACSVICTMILEKTLLPLESVGKKICQEHLKVNKEVSNVQEEKRGSSPLIWIIPVSIVFGVLIGYVVIPMNMTYILDYSLIGSLILLYISVGIGLGTHRRVFKYVQILGWKIILISLAIFIGSLIGGFLAGILLGMPIHISTMSAIGMSYYSLTGAYLTQIYGIEAGTYGFIVNVLREFITLLTLPLLVKISKGSSIAAGAAGDMDTMLVPITKFIGKELGLVTLITGTILTFAVPLLLPLFTHIFFLIL